MTGRYDVILHKLPAGHIESLRMIRQVGGLELRDAKEIYDYLSSWVPCCLLSGVAREKADHAAQLIGEHGGQAAVTESQSAHPMMLWPAADRVFERSLFFGLREARRP